MHFKEQHSFEDRRAEFIKINDKWPNRIPIIAEKYDGGQCKLPELDKKKFLVPDNLTFGQFLYVIRKRMNLPPETAIFLFLKDGFVPTSSSTVRSMYDKFKDEDGFCYCQYSGENTFG